MPITPRLAVSRPLMEKVAVVLHQQANPTDALPAIENMPHTDLTRLIASLVDAPMSPWNRRDEPAQETPQTQPGGTAAEIVYFFVLRNWAVNRSEIVQGTELDAPDVDRALKTLARKHLIASEHVNGERTLTYQTFFDIQNDDEAESKGRAEFDAAL